MGPHLTRRSFALAGASAMLAGCAAPEPARYAAERPVLDMKRYFSGRVLAWGMFTDRSGAVVRRFTVTLECRWDGDDGVLDEDFAFSDGEKQRRTWRVRHLGGGRYTGRAADVVGEATGQASGNSLHWTYTLALPVEGRIWEVQMDDWMHLVDERVLLNRTVMRKFGVRVGEVFISFTRP